MFEELLKTYKIQARQFSEAEQKHFDDQSKDAQWRIQQQEDLLKSMRAKVAKSGVGADDKLELRIRMIEAQKKFTQDLQVLKLKLAEIEALHRVLSSKKGSAVTGGKGKAEVARKQLARLEDQRGLYAASIAQIERERDEARLLAATEALKDRALPGGGVALSTPENARLALAHQQRNAMALKLRAQGLAKIKGELDGEPLSEAQRKTLTQVLVDAGPALALARRCLNDLKPRGAPGDVWTALDNDLTALTQEVTVLKGDVEGAPAASEAMLDRAIAARDKVDGLLARQQSFAQSWLQAKVREAEQAQQASRVKEAVDAWLTGAAEPGPHVKGLLASDLGKLLVKLRREAGSAGKLADKIHQKGGEQKDALHQLLQRLGDAKLDDVVQGYFLLKKNGSKPGVDSLVNKPDDPVADRAFFADTQSVQGSYNDPSNIGKYTYHVTALGNILRKNRVDVDGVAQVRTEGISQGGLSPGQGGKSGGSCEIADKSRDFHGTNIKDASVVNSQNKVAASSNRAQAMKVYITQRENHVDLEMGKKNDKDAALATAVMLRFPVRAEYLGKFGKDPIHLADNLELLDGTPVPPGDIEMLIHRQWVSITDPTVLANYQQMLAIV